MFQELPLGMVAAASAARAHLHSARPDAPVVADEVRPERLRPLRAHLATALRRTADRVAPAPAPCLPARA